MPPSRTPGLPDQVHRHLHVDLLAPPDLDEVDVDEVALDRVALDLLGQGEVLVAPDLQRDQDVDAGVGAQGLAELAGVDAQVLGLGAVAVEHGRDPAGSSQAAGGPFPASERFSAASLYSGMGDEPPRTGLHTQRCPAWAGDDGEGSSGQAMRSSSGAGPCFSSIRSRTASSIGPWWAGSPARHLAELLEGAGDGQAGAVAVEDARVDVGGAAHRRGVAQVVGDLLDRPADRPARAVLDLAWGTSWPGRPRPARSRSRCGSPWR